MDKKNERYVSGDLTIIIFPIRRWWYDEIKYNMYEAIVHMQMKTYKVQIEIWLSTFTGRIMKKQTNE